MDFGNIVVVVHLLLNVLAVAAHTVFGENNRTFIEMTYKRFQQSVQLQCPDRLLQNCSFQSGKCFVSAEPEKTNSNLPTQPEWK
jgi:hypothetical protein